MKIGMLWFDNDPQAELEKKIKRAVEYYIKKYSDPPTVVFVHPSMIGDPNADYVAGCFIKTDKTVPANHFWVGHEQEPQPA